jgi:hypothetical protein
VGAEYLVLWLRITNQIVPIDEGCAMDFSLLPVSTAVVSIYGLGLVSLPLQAHVAMEMETIICMSLPLSF